MQENWKTRSFTWYQVWTVTDINRRTEVACTKSVAGPRIKSAKIKLHNTTHKIPRTETCGVNMSTGMNFWSQTTQGHKNLSLSKPSVMFIVADPKIFFFKCWKSVSVKLFEIINASVYRWVIYCWVWKGLIIWTDNDITTHI